MEGIIFIGIQATGKSTFYKQKFFHTHLRLNLDMLNTRNKESQLLNTCLALHQRVVIDNTNPTVEDRRRYIHLFQKAKYKTVGYYFQSELEKSRFRNQQREGKARIPDIGIISTHKKLILPTYSEGFDELYSVQIVNQDFVITEWKDEI